MLLSFLALFVAEKPILTALYKERKSFYDIKLSDDGIVTGYLGDDIVSDAFFAGGKPFLWSERNLHWLSIKGHERSSVVGYSEGRAVGWVANKQGTWAVEWKRPISADWKAAQPKRLLDEPCEDVVLGSNGSVLVDLGKNLVRLDSSGRTRFAKEACRLVAVDRRDCIYANVLNQWTLRADYAVAFMPGVPMGRLAGTEQPNRVNDVDSKGRAVGHILYDKDESGGMSQLPLPVIWKDGKLQTLLALGPSGDALAIGDGGDVVGWYESGGHRRACLWRGGKCFALSVPVSPEMDSWAVAVNRTGAMAVIAEDDDGRKLYVVPRP